MTLYILFTAFILISLAVLLIPIWKAHSIPKRQRLIFTALISLLFFTGGFGLYHIAGTPQIVPLMSERNARLAELRKTIVARSNDVKANPKNLAAWAELGESFMQTNQYNAAANAFKQAVILSQGNPLLILAYAQALISEADGKVTDDAKRSLDMVLLQDPQNPQARYFLAIRKLQDGHTQEAMHDMRELYRSLPADSPLKDTIDRQIGKK